MHELSLCSALIGEVERVAREHRATRATMIRLALGPLSGAEPALLQSAFPLAAAGTLAEGAELIITEAPLVVRCNLCLHEGEAEPNRLICGKCGSWQTTLVSGDEMLLASVELIDGEEEEA
jgi:hydrogenase nickel incorporation protein HypA/HybF